MLFKYFRMHFKPFSMQFNVLRVIQNLHLFPSHLKLSLRRKSQLHVLGFALLSQSFKNVTQTKSHSRFVKTGGLHRCMNVYFQAGSTYSHTSTSQTDGDGFSETSSDVMDPRPGRPKSNQIASPGLPGTLICFLKDSQGNCDEQSKFYELKNWHIYICNLYL